MTVQRMDAPSERSQAESVEDDPIGTQSVRTQSVRTQSVVTASRYRAVVFLDRDGTVIEERHYLATPDGVALIEGAGSAIRRLNQAQIAVVLVTNQSGVARGYFDEATVRAVHDRLAQDLARDGAVVDAVYYCPHHEEGKLEAYTRLCDCRKPAPGMAFQAILDLGLKDLPTFVVGDKEVDLELGRAIGCPAILVRTGYGAKVEPELALAGRLPDLVAADLPDAVHWILSRLALET